MHGDAKPETGNRRRETGQCPPPVFHFLFPVVCFRFLISLAAGQTFIELESRDCRRRVGQEVTGGSDLWGDTGTLLVLLTDRGVLNVVNNVPVSLHDASPPSDRAR